MSWMCADVTLLATNTAPVTRHCIAADLHQPELCGHRPQKPTLANLSRKTVGRLAGSSWIQRHSLPFSCALILFLNVHRSVPREGDPPVSRGRGVLISLGSRSGGFCPLSAPGLGAGMWGSPGQGDLGEVRWARGPDRATGWLEA